ncbi:TetR/AcrR family transcriptional regulator [Jongsikchunia kroppenstedtii]|uniref:TetR/AcrR family transcriptional regulator n=1 Tax=Jongsikchunia kroppenstedtii TaxID=1121721 RepID=UPI00035EB185|nr:TetR/AcrR family transcriptional regulator [Jongsikchunia kroppenstedtii]
MDRERLVDVALGTISRFGARALSLTSVARHAGVGRATVYRVFGGKDALVAAVVEREISLLDAELNRRLASATTPADQVRVLVHTALDYIRNHQALQYVLQHEPEEILSTVIATGPNRDRRETLIHAILADGMVKLTDNPKLAAALVPNAEAASEFIIRVVHSHMLIPRSHLSDDELADLVVRAVLPGDAPAR